MGGGPECVLLQGIFEDLVQASLAFFAVLALTVKRYLELPRRPWIVWGLDVGKQCCGAAYAHLLNLLISMAISSLLGTGSDECAWYFFLYIIDVTVGTLMNVLLLGLLVAHATRRRRERKLWALLSQNGDYAARAMETSALATQGGREAGSTHRDAEGVLSEALLPAGAEEDQGEGAAPGNVTVSKETLWIWAVQTMAWMAIVTAGKLVILAFVGAVAPILDDLGNWLFGPVQRHAHFELIIVMVMVPSICNVLQFWIQDSFLKKARFGIPYGLPSAAFLRSGISFRRRRPSTAEMPPAPRRDDDGPGGGGAYISFPFGGDHLSAEEEAADVAEAGRTEEAAGARSEGSLAQRLLGMNVFGKPWRLRPDLAAAAKGAPRGRYRRVDGAARRAEVEGASSYAPPAMPSGHADGAAERERDLSMADLAALDADALERAMRQGVGNGESDESSSPDAGGYRPSGSISHFYSGQDSDSGDDVVLDTTFLAEHFPPQATGPPNEVEL